MTDHYTIPDRVPATIIATIPGPTLFIQPTVKEAEKFSKERIAPKTASTEAATPEPEPKASR